MFCSPEEGEEIRKNKKLQSQTRILWSMGKMQKLYSRRNDRKNKNGESYIIRFKSPGREDKKIKHKDVIKGNVEFPENDQDIVIIKADGLPTYHFAHAIDDH